MARQVLGLTGFKQSGKSEAAKHLRVVEGYTHLKFAGTIKKMIAVLLEDLGYKNTNDFIEGHLKEVVIPVLGVSCRTLMQTLGCEWGRDTINKHIWAIVMDARMRDTFGDVVIDDVRFPNEVDFVHLHNGKVARIDRGEDTSLDLHESEQHILKLSPDLTIDSDVPLEEYLRNVQSALEEIRQENNKEEEATNEST